MKTLKSKPTITAIVVMVLITNNASAENLMGGASELNPNILGAYIIGAIVFSALLFYYIRNLLENRKEKAINKYSHLNKLHRRHNRNFWRKNMYKRECQWVDVYKNNIW